MYLTHFCFNAVRKIISVFVLLYTLSELQSKDRSLGTHFQLQATCRCRHKTAGAFSVLRIPDSCWTASELVQYWSSIGPVLIHWRNVALVFFIASLCFQFVKKSQPDKKGKEPSTLYWLLYQFNCAHWADGRITKAYLKCLLARHCKGGLLGGGYWWNVSVSMDEGTGAFVKNTNQIQNVILYFCNRRSQRQSGPSSRDWTWRWNINNNRPRVSPSAPSVNLLMRQRLWMVHYVQFM